ncbi:ChbG/HpnK family deacetylase [Undibacterium arcticum]
MLFEAGLGRVPDFIDGHQHVHQLPVVRELLLELVQTRYAGQRMWIRNTLPATPRWRGKAQILKRLGGAHLARRLEQSGLATNRGFGGVYGFDTDDYASRFEQWLTAAQPGMLLMCHPAIALQDNDAIAAQRVVEYHFFQFSAISGYAGGSRHTFAAPFRHHRRRNRLKPATSDKHAESTTSSRHRRRRHGCMQRLFFWRRRDMKSSSSSAAAMSPKKAVTAMRA